MKKKKSLSNLILLMLENTVNGYVLFEDFTSNPGFYAQGMQRMHRSALANAIRRLRENGFVELNSDKEIALKLTSSGKIKALWIKMKFENEKWDGKWRFVIWDIPEKRRRARDILRYQLKKLGFSQFQQSVWVSKKNCTDLLKKYINDVGIGDWVTVFESEKKDFDYRM